MSDTHILVGMVARLKTPMTREQCSEFNDAHGEEIFVNYEGTLAYVVSLDVMSYDFNMQLGVPMDGAEFESLCIHEGLSIQNDVVLPFVVQWHDSCDSPLSMMTLEDFDNSFRI